MEKIEPKEEIIGNNVLEFKRKPAKPTSAEIRLYHLRLNLQKYLKTKPDVIAVGLIIRDCFKYLILTRPSDTILLQRMAILFNKTKQEIDNGPR